MIILINKSLIRITYVSNLWGYHILPTYWWLQHLSVFFPKHKYIVQYLVVWYRHKYEWFCCASERYTFVFAWLFIDNQCYIYLIYCNQGLLYVKDNISYKERLHFLIFFLFLYKFMCTIYTPICLIYIYSKSNLIQYCMSLALVRRHIRGYNNLVSSVYPATPTYFPFLF